MKPSIKWGIFFAGLLLLTPLLSGCFLRALSGNITGGEDDAVGHVAGTSITASCSSAFAGTEGEFGCLYTLLYVDGELFLDMVSTGQLISEFGLFGVLIDPVILQVPEDVSDVTGTFTDTGTSNTQPLVITETASFNVEPGVEATAEPGQKFIILEFPDGTEYDEVEFDFELTFHYPEVEPVDFKAIFAGRVEAGGQTFYIPLLPCTSDFADVPEFTIPVSNTPQDLTQDLFIYGFNNDDIGCDGEVYDFTAAGPPPTPTPTPAPQPDALWGDDDCNFSVDAVDALKNLQEIAALPYDVEPGCPALESQQTVAPAGFGELMWGDVDCDGDLDAVDALQILRHVAALPVDQEPGCPDVEQPVRFG